MFTNRYDFPINLTTDKYKIDAKSIMGIFSLDLTKPIKVEAHGEDCTELLTDLAPFIQKQ